MRMDQGSRVRLAAGGILALVFAAGTALGFVLDRDPSRASFESPRPWGEASRAPGPQHKAPPDGWIIDRLDLTDEQRSSVDSVIEHFGSLMGDLQKDYRPRYRAVVDSTNRALRGLLTDEQRVRYDSMKARAEAHTTHEREYDPHP